MRRLAVFARSPVPGRVKTRLGPALPERWAAELYAGLLADALAAAADCPVDERYVYWADDEGPAPRRFVPRRQRGADLGERLASAFEQLVLVPGDLALVAGSDIPALTAGRLAAAFDALARHDVVLGPASDGGYWCVGLSRPAPELFHDVRWSTSRVLAHTLERARSTGHSVATVAMLGDLDTPADLALLVGALAAGEPACGDATRAALAAAGLVPSWHGGAFGRA